MPEQIIYTLEAIKIEQQHGADAVGSLCLGDSVRESHPKERAVGEAGKGIVLSEPR